MKYNRIWIQLPYRNTTMEINLNVITSIEPVEKGVLIVTYMEIVNCESKVVYPITIAYLISQIYKVEI